jgi:hypothetical protein
VLRLLRVCLLLLFVIDASISAKGIVTVDMRLVVDTLFADHEGEPFTEGTRLCALSRYLKSSSTARKEGDVSNATKGRPR